MKTSSVLAFGLDCRSGLDYRLVYHFGFSLGLAFGSVFGLAVFTASSAQANTQAIPFYRSPKSPFPSGEASLQSLISTKSIEMTTESYWVQKDGRTFELASDQMLRDLDLTVKVIEPKSGKSAYLLRTDPNLSEIMFENMQKKLVPTKDLVPDVKDLGYAIPIEMTPLHSQPDARTATVQEAVPLEKFRVLGFAKNYVLGQSITDSKRKGYLELSKVITKIDFAEHVLLNNSQWKSFIHRQGQYAKVDSSKSIPLSEITALTTKPALGILKKSIPEHRLVARSTVEIKKNNWTTWVQSHLKDHGPVVWNKKLSIESLEPPRISTAEILSKTLFSSATDARPGQKHAIASSDGVFLTTNGHDWNEVTLFRKQNLPVAIGPRGEFFVGGYQSLDAGKTFSPYLKWEELTHLLHQRHRQTPKLLKVTEILPKDQQKIQITLDTGVWKSSLIGSLSGGFVRNWNIVKER